GERSVHVACFEGAGAAGSYTLSLHDALPIWRRPTKDVPGDDEFLQEGEGQPHGGVSADPDPDAGVYRPLLGIVRERRVAPGAVRSEEHTSELQSRENLVCRLLLEKKNT